MESHPCSGTLFAIKKIMKLPKPFLKNSDILNVIIETPKGCGNKYSYDARTGLFKLSKVLPEGLVFPLHFGFVPGTKGDDGDPLDVMVLMDEMSFPGNLIECKPLGIIEAEQTENDEKATRNDRIVATAVESRRYSELKSIKQIDKYMLDEITKFFITYNAMSGKKFTLLSYRGPSHAINVIKKQLK